MATAASSTVECGYCSQKHEDLDEPKVLPCGHIHCLSCLIGAFEEPKLITCPSCGVVCQSQPPTLADADVTRGKPKQLCDPCTHKGNKKRSATGYCSTCNKKFCDSHVGVDVIAGFKDVKQQMDKLGADGFPILSVTGVLQLSKKERSREIEVEALPTTVMISVMSTKYPTSLKPAKGFMFPTPIPNPKAKTKAPTSLRLIKAVKVAGLCMSVSCQYNITYVGHSSGIDRILDGQMTPDQYFRRSEPGIDGLATKDNIQYSLSYTGLSCLLYRHDLSKRELKEFQHMDTTTHIQNLTIAGDKVVIPNITRQCLAIYSLVGKMEREIACSQLGTESTAICTLDNNSVIVTADSTRETFRVNLTSAEIVWTSVHLPSVGGVACYDGRYVFVAENDGHITDISVLDAMTGILLDNLTDPTKRRESWVPDLHVNGNTLIVPRYDEKLVLFYEIQ